MRRDNVEDKILGSADAACAWLLALILLITAIGLSNVGVFIRTFIA